MARVFPIGSASQVCSLRMGMARAAAMVTSRRAPRLLADLVNLGLAETRDTRELRAQMPGLRFTDYRITAKGTRLLAGLETVEPLIEDERI
jgi:predicted transcriptional regulator